MLTVLSLLGCDLNSDKGSATEAIVEPVAATDATATRPNILFISIDELNDWIEPLGGHPQAITPNLTRLANEGVNFTHAYTASPACNPSRMALLSGQHTYRTGMYSNYQSWQEVMPDVETLPEYFAAQGYWTGGAGKIFHNGQPDPDSWDEYFPSKQKPFPDYFYPGGESTVSMPAFESMYTDFDWSPIDLATEDTGDYQSVNWALNELAKERQKPFFMAVGIYRPHLPWYVPKEYFDRFPLDQVELPKTLENDMDDVPGRGHNIASRAGNLER